MCLERDHESSFTEQQPELAMQHVFRVLEPKFFARGTRTRIERCHPELLSDFGGLFEFLVNAAAAGCIDEYLAEQARDTSGRGPICFACRGKHRYMECPTFSPEEIRAKKAQYRAARRQKSRRLAQSRQEHPQCFSKSSQDFRPRLGFGGCNRNIRIAERD